MFSKKIILVITALILSMVLASCGSDENSDTREAVKVNVKKVESREVSDVFEFSGNIEGVQRVKLSTKLMGTIVSFPYEAGAKIKKGDLLVKINSSDILAKKRQVMANISQAETALKNMEINFNRVKNLYEKKSATKKEMEDIQMAYDMAKAQADAAREMKKEVEDVLSYANIKAPFDGYIVNKFFQEGDIAAPGHPIAIVENFSGFKVKTYVSAGDINRFERGEIVTVRLDELNGKMLEGKVVEINPGAHPASRQYAIQVLIDAANQNLDGVKSGMYAKVVLENSKRNMITVDEENLITRGQLKGVYTVSTNNEAMLRWLRIGKNFKGKMEVLSGLSDGDMIIIDKDIVTEGQKVEVI
ncbi:MAG: efflux RND transporter periplasmic adaptor subunit [Ignavibacteriae bacterium]|nr:efflux RND transporter periplasmic adaptor subunit [Ignavibacteriota bacterium]NOG99312.1 efflux RND transporter periplasmic adaptor subunit [Ignavibacteriota bacterium]